MQLYNEEMLRQQPVESAANLNYCGWMIVIIITTLKTSWWKRPSLQL